MSQGGVNNDPRKRGDVVVLKQANTDECAPAPQMVGRPDMLSQVFQGQAEFAQHLHERGTHRRASIDFKRLYEGCPNQLRELYRAVGSMAQALMMESSELLDWTAWKHWSSQMGNKRKDIKPGSPEHIKEMRVECADIFCFLVNACQNLGMSAEDLYKEWHEKMQENVRRQDSGTY